MKVLFVINNIYAKGNGLCTSAQVTVKYLREAGVDARFLTAENPSPKGGQPDFPLKRVHVPVFQYVLDNNGFVFAKTDKDMVRKAVEWADVVHLEEPFWLEKSVAKLAKKMGKPVVGTFHIYTQNILNEIPFMNVPAWCNDIYMKLWIRKYYKDYDHLQCPTEPVKRLLEKYHCPAKLHVISNGVRIPQERVVAQTPTYPPYKILSVGRFSKVKGQRVLLEAMKYSKYAEDILLYFAGKGTDKEYLEKQADILLNNGTLRHPPVFAFHTHEGLKKVARTAYLYSHNASLEVEGLGCIEALCNGLVPIIAKGELIGTTDFALDERSVYTCGDAKELAQKIDWWIEHPQERDEMAQKYADFARTKDVHFSIEKLLAMYNEALEQKK